MPVKDYSWYVQEGKRFKTKNDLIEYIRRLHPDIELHASWNKNSITSSWYQYEKEEGANDVDSMNDLFKDVKEFSKTKQENYKLIDTMLRERHIEHKYNDIRSFHNKVIDFETAPLWKTHAISNQFAKISNSSPETARVLFRITTMDGTVKHLRLNANNIEKIAGIIDAGGYYFADDDNDKEGSDIPWLVDGTEIASIQIIDIDQLPDELKKYHIKGYSHGGYFPYILTTEKYGDLSSYQIYQREQTRDDSNCLIFALKQAGVNEQTILNISHDFTEFPFITTGGVNYIADKYHLHIWLSILYAKETKYLEFGPKKEPAINIGIYKNHAFFISDYKQRRNILKLIRTVMNDTDSLEPLPISFSRSVHELPVSFSVSEHETRAYQSKSKNPVSKFYNSISDLYQIGGNVQYAIRKCCYGPRVLVSKKKYRIQEPILSLDVNALYPYAMTKLFIQKGKPKTLGAQSFEYMLEHQFEDNQITKNNKHFISSAFMLIHIDAIGKQRQYSVIPNLSIGEHWVDLITLEDLIKYHEIKGRVLNGFYYDDDRDYSIRSFIRSLYSKRAEHPELKTIMNKIYGYTIRKRLHTKNITVKNSFEYMIENYDLVLSSDENTVKRYKKWTSLYNMANFGSYILSMSKRIMNSILYDLEDKGVEVLYSDTDSIFIRERDFKAIDYPIGSEIGELKNDFAKDGYERAQEMVIVGKKRYCCKYADGNTHFRYIFINKNSIENPFEYCLSQI